VLVLLPPSAGKAEGGDGPPLDLGALSFAAELGRLRARILRNLAKASARRDALRRLDAPAGAADQVRANVTLAQAPTLAAAQRYTGVLYDALGLATLDADAQEWAERSVVIVSALFGALRPQDRIPAYRLAMGVDLAGVGPLASAWRRPLGTALAAAAGDGLVVDCRSAPYVAAWPAPRGPRVERFVAVRVLREEAGKRTVVSHMAKQTRGAIVRTLLESGADPQTPRQLADVVSAKWRVELAEPDRAGTAWRLDVIDG